MRNQAQVEQARELILATIKSADKQGSFPLVQRLAFAASVLDWVLDIEGELSLRFEHILHDCHSMIQEENEE